MNRPAGRSIARDEAMCSAQRPDRAATTKQQDGHHDSASQEIAKIPHRGEQVIADV
jgi:hypothetical protein